MNRALPIFAFAALALAGCGKKEPATPPPAPARPPESAPAPTTSGSLGGAPKRILDDAQAKIDAVQKKEAAAADEVR